MMQPPNAPERSASRSGLPSGTTACVERACGFDRSQLYSDEGPPIGAVASEPWVEQDLETVAWMLRWN
jgi:hypothetical protein